MNPTIKGIMIAMVVLSLGLRFVNLDADFPQGVTWSGVLHTDEGDFTLGAIRRVTTGEWRVEGDVNHIVYLPVFQLIQFPVFKALGLSLISARFTVAVIFVLTIGMTHLLVCRYADAAVALVTTLLLSVNFMLYAFSRLAILELTMVFFAVAGLLIASLGSRRTYFVRVVLAAVVFVISVLTKTSIVAVLLTLLYVVWLNGPERKQRLVACACVVLIVFGLVFAYSVAIKHFFPADCKYFTDSLGGDVSAKAAEGSVVQSGVRDMVRVVWNGRALGQVMYWPALILLPAGLCLSRQFRRSPLLPIVLIWIAFYGLSLVPRGYMPPRYYIPLSIPITAIFAMACVYLHRRYRPKTGAYVALGLVGLVVAANAFRLTRYMCLPEYSFRDMARDVQRRVDADRPGRVVMLGYMASTVSLVTGHSTINDQIGSRDLEWKLRAHRPNYYISRGKRMEVLSVLERSYDMELLSVYDVFHNYFNDRPVYFYRLTEKPGALAEARA